MVCLILGPREIDLPKRHMDDAMKLVEPHWDLENLEKAYRRGFMAGMVGKEGNSCPHKAEVVVNAWEAGWQDGKEQYDIKHAPTLKQTL